eukprot:m.419306 g.419306  ORF g.419306 m.419306 type:complete len:273 (-) comp31442_c0_seq1:206-1024(-)
MARVVMHDLYTIPFSHYCEAARWALQVGGIPFKEWAYHPGGHFLASPVGRLRKNAGCKGTGTPLMMLGDQVVGNDSSECVAKLGAVDPELLALVDKDIGVTGRAICYSHLLVPGEGYDTLDKMCFESQNLATWQGALFQAGPFRRVVYAKMSKAMVKSPEYIEKCRDRLAAALDTIATMLDQPEFALPGQAAAANAKPGPTATGITVASLLYPVVFPPEIQRVIFGEGSTVGSLEEMPQALQDEFKRWRATKAGTWCLQYYAAYRLESLSKI